jgi:hypothetical protein
MIRVPQKGDAIEAQIVPGLWLPAVVASSPEFGPAGHASGIFAFEVAGTCGNHIGGASHVVTAEFAPGEGTLWRWR